MQLGAEAVFVGSGIFKSSDPAKRAKAIVQATTHFKDADVLARVSEELGEAMVGLEIVEAGPEDDCSRRAAGRHASASRRCQMSEPHAGIGVLAPPG